MADGSAICKVGTYPAALAAQNHGVPVYVLVDTLKFNATSASAYHSENRPDSRQHLLRVALTRRPA
jgi:translation initiation factor 2B subunit (eIF-2B alpha/beta/delta family)